MVSGAGRSRGSHRTRHRAHVSAGCGRPRARPTRLRPAPARGRSTDRAALILWRADPMRARSRPGSPRPCRCGARRRPLLQSTMQRNQRSGRSDFHCRCGNTGLARRRGGVLAGRCARPAHRCRYRRTSPRSRVRRRDQGAREPGASRGVVRAARSRTGHRSNIRSAAYADVWKTFHRRQQDYFSARVELEQLAGTPNSVSLVTGDAGMRLRAAQRDVKAVAMPEKYLRETDKGGE